MEVAAAAGDGLLDAINHIARNIEAVLYNNVRAAETVEDPYEPEEEGGAGALRALHDAMRTVEDTRPWNSIINEEEPHTAP